MLPGLPVMGQVGWGWARVRGLTTVVLPVPLQLLQVRGIPLGALWEPGMRVHALQPRASCLLPHPAPARSGQLTR